MGDRFRSLSVLPLREDLRTPPGSVWAFHEDIEGEIDIRGEGNWNYYQYLGITNN